MPGVPQHDGLRPRAPPGLQHAAQDGRQRLHRHKLPSGDSALDPWPDWPRQLLSQEPGRLADAVVQLRDVPLGCPWWIRYQRAHGPAHQRVHQQRDLRSVPQLGLARRRRPDLLRHDHGRLLVHQLPVQLGSARLSQRAPGSPGAQGYDHDYNTDSYCRDCHWAV